MVEPARQRREEVLDAYVALFNDPPGSREGLRSLLSDDVHFSDPFNELTGPDAVHRMLAHFVERVGPAEFVPSYRGWDGDVCLLRWEMRARIPVIGEWVVPGVSELHFDAGDRICLHVDHWDAAGYLYQHLPLIGRLMRLLRRRFSAA